MKDSGLTIRKSGDVSFWNSHLSDLGIRINQLCKNWSRGCRFYDNRPRRFVRMPRRHKAVVAKVMMDGHKNKLESHWKSRHKLLRPRGPAASELIYIDDL